MSNLITLEHPIEVDVRNIGGIEDSTVTFEPGLTVLSGRNATNRTSFLEALMAVHGSENVSLKADADEGHVRLTTGDDTYERHFTRENGRIVASGDPILDDPMVADLFAFLLEANEARRAVERNENLRDLIMRPVDTDAIEAEITDFTAEKQRIDQQIEELDGLERRVTDLEAERSSLKREIEEKEAELQEKREQIESSDGDVEETQEVKAELERKLDELWSARSDLDDVEYDLETERGSLASLEEEIEALESELGSLPEMPMGELETVEDRLDVLHSRKQSITSELNQLQNIIQFNEDMLDGTDSELLGALSDENEGDTSASVTDQLVAGNESVVCWTCGEAVDEEHISKTLDGLRSLRQEKLKERNQVDEEIRSTQSKRDDLESQQRQRDEIERTLRQRERQIDHRKETTEDLTARREDLEARVEELESTVEDLRVEEQSEVLDLHKEANQLEFEIERLEGDLEDVEEELETIDSRLAGRDDLEARREEIQTSLEELRSRVERIEGDAVEAFNTHMAAVLDRLDYANIERVWIERTERTVRNGRRKESKGVFELHIVRESASGTVYEDSIDHLSESEREVIGLTFALAGYLVHDVHETVPFMLLDSLEALDSARIADLVEYMNTYADNVVVALLPEDADALDDEYERVTEI